MNEPVTIARVRKETKITVPAGGWVLLVGPDQHFGDHAAKRMEVVNSGLVNETYETIKVGRLRNTHSDVKLITKSEREAADREIEKTNAMLSRSAEDAKKRAEGLQADSLEKEKADLAARVVEVSKENDAIRNRKI